MTRAGRIIARLWRAQEGSVLVEFAFYGPMLVIMLMAVIDLGGGFYNQLTLRTAARIGAEYALARPTDTAGIAAAVRQSSDFGSVEVSVNSTIVCECPDGSPLTCGSTCAAPGPARAYVRVTVSQGFSPMVPFWSVLAPDTLAAEVMMRFR